MPTEPDAITTSAPAAAAHPPSTTPDAKPAPKVKRAVQDQALANYLSASETFLKTASTDEEIKSVLSTTYGYNEGEFARGFELLIEAKQSYAARQGGIGEKGDASDTLQADTGAARDTYASFREIARACFQGGDDRVGLGLTGNVPEDFEKFVTAAHTSYTNGRKAPYTTKLTKRGYPVARLTALLADLDTLTGTDSTRDTAEGDAKDDTTARDSAYLDLKEFMKELQGVCRGAFRKQAGVLGKLKL